MTISKRAAESTTARSRVATNSKSERTTMQNGRRSGRTQTIIVETARHTQACVGVVRIFG